MPNAETILALVQLGRFAIDAIEALQRGKMTEADIAKEWAEVRGRLDQANRLWEQAGR